MEGSSSKRGLLLLPPVLVAALVCVVWFVGHRARTEQLAEVAELIHFRGEDEADLDEMYAGLLGGVASGESGCLERVTETLADLQDVRAATLLTFREREAHLLSKLGSAIAGCAEASSADERARATRSLVDLSESEPSHAYDAELMLRLWAIQEDVEAASAFDQAWDLVQGDTNERLRAIRAQHQEEIDGGRPWGEVVRDGFELHATTIWNVRQLRLLAFLVDAETTREHMADASDPLLLSHARGVSMGRTTIDGEPTDHVGAHLCTRHGFERMRELSGRVRLRIVPTGAGTDVSIGESTLDPLIAVCMREALRLVPLGDGERNVTVEVSPPSPGLSNGTGVFQ